MAFSNIGVFLAIALAVFLCYFLILDVPFKTMDDYVSIIENPLVKSLGNVPQIFKSSFFSKNTYWRPLVHLSFALEYKFFSLNSFYYYLDNILLHILASFGVFLLVEKLFSRRMVGFLTGMLFAVHPVHWEQVTNVPGRAILLCGLFFIYSFWMFIKVFGSGKARHLMLALLFYALSLLSKESAVMLPVCVIAYSLIFAPRRERSDEQTKNISFVTNLFLIVTVAYFFCREMLGISGGFKWAGLKYTILSMITFLKAVVIYLRLIIFPVGLYYDRSLDVFDGFLVPQVASTLVVWLIVIYFVVKNWPGFSKVSKFMLAWTVINFVTVSQVVPVKVGYFSISTAEHFLYIPSIALLAMIVAFMVNLSKTLIVDNKVRKGIVVLAAAGLYSFYFLVTIDQVIVSSNQITMFKRSFEQNPKNIRVITPLALAYAYAGMYEEAEKYYKESLKVEPGNVRGLIGAGQALCDQGKYWHGMNYFEQVVDAGEFEGLLKKNIKAANKAMEDTYKKGIENLSGRITNDAQKFELAQLHYSLGVVYHSTENIEKAILEYKRAITINQKYEQAYLNLAAAYEKTGQKDKALKMYDDILFSIPLSEEKMRYVSARLDKLNSKP